MYSAQMDILYQIAANKACYIVIDTWYQVWMLANLVLQHHYPTVSKFRDKEFFQHVDFVERYAVVFFNEKIQIISTVTLISLNIHVSSVLPLAM